MDSQRRLIDWHMHTHLREHLGPEWGGQLERKYGPKGTIATFDDIDEAREEAGVEIAVIIALKSDLLQMAMPNEFVAEYVEARKHNTLGFASVDPNDPKAVDELRYAVETLGLKGLKLSPPYQAFHPHSPEAERVFKAAAELKLVLMFHQGAVFLRRGVLEYAQPVLLDKLARDYPEMPIIFAHVGQPWYSDVIAMMYKHPNVFADIAARCHRPWQLHNILLGAQDYRVADKILFGSDFPVLRPQFCVEALRSINERTENRLPPIPSELVEDIMFNRPLSLVGLELETAGAAA